MSTATELPPTTIPVAPATTSSTTAYPIFSHLPPLPQVSKADPASSVFDAFRIAIASSIAKAVPDLTVEQVYEGVDYGKKGVDFTVALPRFRLKEKPDVTGKKVLAEFKADEWIESVVAQGPFLHYQLNTATLFREVLTQIHQLTNETEKPLYGTSKIGEGKKVIIEYSSPNIAKQFHVGHLRSTIIGQFLSNVYSACGWEVIAMNYLGDWGTQFGLIAVGFERYGSEEALKVDAIKHLYDVYVKINAEAEKDPEVRVEAAKWFKRMEDGDETALVNWRKWRELSVKKYTEEYAALNVRFDVYTGESQVGKESQAQALARLEEMGLISDVEGAKLIDLEKWKLQKAVVRKKDGTSIYLTRDIGGAIERYEKYKFDKMIYVVASQQDLHLAQFFKVLQLLEYPWANTLEHVNYGLVQGMSTRKGTAVFLADIIREAGNVMHDQMKKNKEKYEAVEDPEGTSKEIGITAVKVQDMQAKRINNYVFNWDRMTTFEGDTGPYLQYAHVRVSSISRKNPSLHPLPPPSQINTSLLTSHPKAREIAILLGSYPDVVKTALKTHEPSGVVTFAMRLSHAISGAWDVLGVKSEVDKGDLESARARMWLYLSARDVLGASMRLLSLTPLERM
ncbi:arginyl-tRNA synthetase [Sistotremastrum niveocremeum HHB9708]|uniref:arginine--tRNA ligase n=1 Tax=Sistotremastrum niveocremeum HHB9708 TaxID=1314777 RepID=A0A164XZ68_9AGAM|nr:arginyl-tRNA synthetase [Sistotremastrum niveocremeum HHB9708]